MRIGYVLKKFPKLSETFVLNEILALEELGHEVTVFSLSLPDETRFHAGVSHLRGEIRQLGVGRSADFARRLSSERVILEQARMNHWEGFWDLLGTPEKDPLRLGRQALELRLAAEELGIEHLHAHFAGPATDTARAAAGLARIPWSFTCHAKDIYHESVDPDRFVRWVERADAVVTVCEANRRFIEEERVGTATPHLHRLYNGIDLRRFHPERRRPSKSPLILGVGRLVEKKGFADLIDAAASLRERGLRFRCVIAGEGREKTALERQIRERQLHREVELVGAVDQERVTELLGSATVLALPCLVGDDGNRDALPTVILEAMASGVPVVSTPVGGIEEMLDDGANGVLVPSRDPAALADALERLANDAPLRERLARRGRARAQEDFDLRRNVARLAEIFRACRTASQVEAMA